MERRTLCEKQREKAKTWRWRGVPGVSLPSRCDTSSVFIKSFTLFLSLSFNPSFRSIILLFLLKVKKQDECCLRDSIPWYDFQSNRTWIISMNNHHLRDMRGYVSPRPQRIDSLALISFFSFPLLPLLLLLSFFSRERKKEIRSHDKTITFWVILHWRRYCVCKPYTWLLSR